ncbi:hypothetical protein M0R04_04650 [Candidatus Dojkabacteria bacterium]|jgi:hypothetical protein|nr:hypothetical protein [Candidatus Dojkabacteria bacterium]
MTRNTAKNRVNKILHESSKGIFSDDSWNQIHNIFRELSENGFQADIMSTMYHQNVYGIPISKEWRIQITVETGKPLNGIITAHGAGSVEYPLDRYDISAYVC